MIAASPFEAGAYTPPSGRALEDAWRHRMAVWANTLAAFGAYGTVDPDANVWLPMIVVTAGSAFSHWRRRHGNIGVKWLLAAGMLYALWVSLENLVQGQIDPRLSLAQLLLSLQVLNSFDLPRRRNLRVALLVASVLMVVSGTLSRTFGFGWLAAGFSVSLIWALLEGTISETGAKPPGLRQVLMTTAATLTALAVFGLPFFILAPRKARTLSGTTLPLSLQIPLPDAHDPHIRAPLTGTGQADNSGQIRRAYAGFSNHLDLNVRMIPTNEVVLRVKADRPAYWRAMAFDMYDGRGWQMREPDKVTQLNGASPPIKLRLPQGQRPGVSLVQTFYVESDNANLIFCAYPPVEIYYPTALIWSDAYGGLRSPVTLQKDMIYSIVSNPPYRVREQLLKQKAKPLTAELRGYLSVPPVSDRVQTLVKQITAKADTPYKVMDDLEAYLTTTYPYQLDVPAAPPGAEWVDNFLFVQRAGFCEQFATSLAIMGRLAGIPTRLVTGYAPGDYNPFTGYYDVHSRDAHAWVEAWMPNQGWVPFDATPGSTVEAEDSGQDSHAREVAAALWRYMTPLFAGKPWAQGLLALTLVGLLLLGYRAVRNLVPPPRRSTALYRSLRRQLARRGVADDPSLTPRAWLEAAARVPAVAPALPPLRDFVARYEAARFGGNEEAPEALADLNKLVRSVEQELARR